MSILAMNDIFQEKIFQPEPLPASHRFSFSEPFKEIMLNVAGAALNALHFRANESKGVILYLHGNAGNLESWGKVAVALLEHEYDVFIIDYRGYGKSTGKITSEQMLHDDMDVAYAHLRQRYAQEEIIIFGRSLGTGLATRLASVNQPKMLILESPYFSMVDLVKRQVAVIPSFAVPYPLRTHQWIINVTCPIYLFHGDQDRVIPHDSSERLAQLLEGEHGLFLIEGGGHNNLGNKEKYRTELARILR